MLVRNAVSLFIPQCSLCFPLPREPSPLATTSSHCKHMPVQIHPIHRVSKIKTGCIPGIGTCRQGDRHVIMKFWWEKRNVFSPDFLLKVSWSTLAYQQVQGLTTCHFIYYYWNVQTGRMQLLEILTEETQGKEIFPMQ